MSTFVVGDQQVYWGKYDITGDLSGVELSIGVDAQESTALGDGTHTMSPGLETVDFSYSGFWNGGDDEIDDISFDNMGASQVVTVAAEDGTDGSVGYAFKQLHTSYTQGAGVGEMFTISASGNAADNRAVRGTIMIPKAAYTSTDNGTAQQLGAVAAGERVYASLHVTAVSGTDPTLDVIVESDDNAGISSGTTRLTFTQATAATSEFLSAAGAITDDYWRVGYTIGGTDTPTFTFVVCVGIR